MHVTITSISSLEYLNFFTNRLRAASRREGRKERKGREQGEVSNFVAQNSVGVAHRRHRFQILPRLGDRVSLLIAITLKVYPT
ncbi:hypothetical protein FNW02_05095 [Komarekiella sp. 'clone 1']|uniref:Uncharacterized protein n=1 Tax=Komarekiella delphini-convector SJRDD-AB1 TaxID=2593771 RepID=A0AA40VPX0_9NOST|nr:hypothetical protein [Komarekiella delphini-convector SJRDD-AB1]